MHSSKMRTVSCSGCLGWGGGICLAGVSAWRECLPEGGVCVGGCLPRGGVCLGCVCLPGGVCPEGCLPLCVCGGGVCLGVVSAEGVSA